MIEVKGVSREFDGLQAVDEVSFSIGQGEIVGLLGHNGAGKSTIMKMLTGGLDPTSGEISIAGRPMQSDPAAARRLIGYLPENCPLYPEMRVMEYLAFQAELKGIAPSLRDERLATVLRQTRLRERAASRIGTLSRGMRQRVGVAQALLGEPKILVLDEPTSGLDPTQIEQMHSLVRNAAERATVVVSTHILQEVEAVCDRVLIMRNGRLVVDRRLDAIDVSRQLRVVVDRPGEAVLELLSGIGEVETDGDACLLTVPVDDPSATALEVSRQLSAEGFGLIELRPERQSLERLFRESQGQAHA